MEYSQKYTLVAFLNPKEFGTTFNMADWPLHITLADVFAIELTAAIETKLTTLLAQQSPIHLTVGEDATLGTAEVALINKNVELQNLHNKIIDLLEINGVEFNTPDFIRKGFLAHSTIQKSGRLNDGDKVEITSVSLVDMFPDGDWQQRKVLNSFNLQALKD